MSARKRSRRISQRQSKAILVHESKFFRLLSLARFESKVIWLVRARVSFTGHFTGHCFIDRKLIKNKQFSPRSKTIFCIRIRARRPGDTSGPDHQNLLICSKVTGVHQSEACNVECDLQKYLAVFASTTPPMNNYYNYSITKTVRRQLFLHPCSLSTSGARLNYATPQPTFPRRQATILDTQLESHCSDTCLCLFQFCFVRVFRWSRPSLRPTLGRKKGKRGRAQHVIVIPSIDPSSSIRDCRQ